MTLCDGEVVWYIVAVNDFLLGNLLESIGERIIGISHQPSIQLCDQLIIDNSRHENSFLLGSCLEELEKIAVSGSGSFSKLLEELLQILCGGHCAIVMIEVHGQLHQKLHEALKFDRSCWCLWFLLTVRTLLFSQCLLVAKNLCVTIFFLEYVLVNRFKHLKNLFLRGLQSGNLEVLEKLHALRHCHKLILALELFECVV